MSNVKGFVTINNVIWNKVVEYYGQDFQEKTTKILRSLLYLCFRAQQKPISIESIGEKDISFDIRLKTLILILKKITHGDQNYIEKKFSSFSMVSLPKYLEISCAFKKMHKINVKLFDADNKIEIVQLLGGKTSNRYDFMLKLKLTVDMEKMKTLMTGYNSIWKFNSNKVIINFCDLLKLEKNSINFINTLYNKRYIEN